MNIRAVKNGFIKYFRIWWIPIISFLIPFGIFLLGLALQRDFITNTSLILFYLNVLGSIISSIIQVIIKKWYLLFPQLIVAGFLFFFVGMIFLYSPPDFYGTHKKIPDNIEISEPIDSIPTQRDYEKHDLILTVYGQPGIYEYYTDFIPTEPGHFYLKAFEITSGDKLSESRIKERTKISVDPMNRNPLSADFTIYEGSWGDKYAARIELWFEPVSGESDYKITERNYIVEGWMR